MRVAFTILAVLVATLAQAQTLTLRHVAALADGGAVLAQTPAPTFVLGQALRAEWSPIPDEAVSGTTVYEVRMDAGAWGGTGQAVPQASYRYAIPQAQLTLGAHVLYMRACQSAGAGCGPESSGAFTIVRPLPGRVPFTIGPVVPGVALSLPAAVEVAHAYARLITSPPRGLTDGELAELARRHGNVTPTKESVLAVLDASFAQLMGR